MPATTHSGPARANVNRSHKYHRPAANAAGKQVGPSSDNFGGHRVSDNDGPAKKGMWPNMPYGIHNTIQCGSKNNYPHTTCVNFCQTAGNF